MEYTYTWSTTNPTDQVVEEKHTFAGEGPWTVQSTIDDVGVRTSLKYPHASGESYRTLSFTNDDLQRLTAITEGGDTIADYEYKGLYLQERGIGDSGGNGVRIVKLTFKDSSDLDGYDEWGRIKWMRHYKVSGATDRAKYEYGYDYASNRTYQEDLVNATTDELYAYDTLHRLTSFERGDLNVAKDDITDTPAREQSWTLEVIGNWDAIVSKTNRVDDTPYDTRTHNTVNEITALDPQGGVGSFNLDWGEGASKSGNLYILPDRTDPANKADRFHYDYRNRLIKVEHSDDYAEGTPSWSTVVTYYYDGLNRRVKKDLATGTDIIYLYDGWQVLEEREWDTNGEGAEDDKWEARRQYVYGAIYIDEVLIFDKDTDDDGDCVDGGGSSRHFYCQQANWNVVAVTDSSGDTDEKIKYDAYGEATVTVQGGHSATGNPYLFQGRRWDSEVSLYCFRYRVSSPVLGRFLQRDPIRYRTSMNLYLALLANPYIRLDPYGLDALKLCRRQKKQLLYRVLIDLENCGVEGGVYEDIGVPLAYRAAYYAGHGLRWRGARKLIHRVGVRAILTPIEVVRLTSGEKIAEEIVRQALKKTWERLADDAREAILISLEGYQQIAFERWDEVWDCYCQLLILYNPQNGSVIGFIKGKIGVDPTPGRVWGYVGGRAPEEFRFAFTAKKVRKVPWQLRVELSEFMYPVVPETITQ